MPRGAKNLFDIAYYFADYFRKDRGLSRVSQMGEFLTSSERESYLRFRAEQTKTLDFRKIWEKGSER